MGQDMFNEVKEEIDKITKSAPAAIEYPHSQVVLQYVLKLKPDADTALKIAALGHDIDRSLPERRIHSEGFTDYNEYKRQHSKRSAEIVAEIMQRCGCSRHLIESVNILIENHEVGGAGDVEILKEADSISFFQDSLAYYRETYPVYFKDKIRFMYTRLSSRARALVRTLTISDLKLKKEVMDAIEEIESSGA